MIILQSGYRLFKNEYAPDMYVILQNNHEYAVQWPGSAVALPQ